MTGRLHALFLHLFAGRSNRLAGSLKRDLFSRLEGDVLEIGAGSGATFQFLPRSIRWVGSDPNPHGRPYAFRLAAKHGIHAEWCTSPAEHLPFGDATFDAALCTLTLCSVRQPHRAVEEVRRVLRPGAPFVFLEHVTAPEGSSLIRRQRLWRPVFRCCLGCTPDRDTAALLRKSSFSSLEMKEFSLPIPIVAPHIAGIARR